MSAVRYLNEAVSTTLGEQAGKCYQEGAACYAQSVRLTAVWYPCQYGIRTLTSMDGGKAK